MELSLLDTWQVLHASENHIVFYSPIYTSYSHLECFLNYLPNLLQYDFLKYELEIFQFLTLSLCLLQIFLIGNLACFYLKNNNFLYFLEERQEIFTSSNPILDHNPIFFWEAAKAFLRGKPSFL